MVVYINYIALAIDPFLGPCYLIPCLAPSQGNPVPIPAVAASFVFAPLEEQQLATLVAPAKTN